MASASVGSSPTSGTTSNERRCIPAPPRSDAALKVTDLALDGKDVMRILEIPPSRRIGQILEWLLERVLDDPSLNTREKLEELLRTELPPAQ